jgi:hypothetical protein
MGPPPSPVFAYADTNAGCSKEMWFICARSEELVVGVVVLFFARSQPVWVKSIASRKSMLERRVFSPVRKARP